MSESQLLIVYPSFDGERWHNVTWLTFSRNKHFLVMCERVLGFSFKIFFPKILINCILFVNRLKKIILINDNKLFFFCNRKSKRKFVTAHVDVIIERFSKKFLKHKSLPLKKIYNKYVILCGKKIECYIVTFWNKTLLTRDKQ